MPVKGDLDSFFCFFTGGILYSRISYAGLLGRSEPPISARRGFPTESANERKAASFTRLILDLLKEVG